MLVVYRYKLVRLGRLVIGDGRASETVTKRSLLQHNAQRYIILFMSQLTWEWESHKLRLKLKTRKNPYVGYGVSPSLRTNLEQRFFVFYFFSLNLAWVGQKLNTLYSDYKNSICTIHKYKLLLWLLQLIVIVRLQYNSTIILCLPAHFKELTPTVYSFACSHFNLIESKNMCNCGNPLSLL